MTILVLGSEGFIGSHMVQFFLHAGHNVIGCDLPELPKSTAYIYARNTKEEDFWASLLQTQQVDVCINASGSGNVAYSIQQPVKDFEANCYDVIKVLDAIRLYSPACKYVHISSAAVYGNPERLPVTEDAALTPLSPYGWHKLLSEQVCKEYCALYELKIAVIRPFSVYGNGLRKQLLWDICCKLQRSDTISLFGTGKESRDFIHIHDLARLMLTVITNGDFNGEVYNAANGEEVTIRQVADMFCAYFPGQKTISFSGAAKQGDPINWKADIGKVTALGFAPGINMKDAVKEYIDWFKKQEHEQ